MEVLSKKIKDKQNCAQTELPEDGSGTFSLHAGRHACHEAKSASIRPSELKHVPVCIWAALPDSLSKRISWSFISHYSGGSRSGSPGLWGRKLDLQKQPRLNRNVWDVAQTCHRCCWVGCIEQAPLPAHKSLPPRSPSRVSKMLPAKCSKLPGTRCRTNISLIMVSNLQIWALCLEIQREEWGWVGRSKRCLLGLFWQETEPLLLSLSKAQPSACGRCFLSWNACFLFPFFF